MNIFVQALPAKYTVIGRYTSTYKSSSINITVQNITSTGATIVIDNYDEVAVRNVYIKTTNGSLKKVYDGSSNAYITINLNGKLKKDTHYYVYINIDPDGNILEGETYAEASFTTLADDSISEICSNEFENYIQSSLHKTFRTLKFTGFVKPIDIQKLIALDAIEDMLYGSLSHCMSNKDKKIIDNFLNRIYGSSCLFPYPNCLNCGNSGEDEYDYDTNNILDPIITSFWHDDEYWKDHKIWSDKGIYF